MKCPKCNSENVVMVGELARCQTCENYYKPFADDLADNVQSRPLPGSVDKGDFMRERNLALVRSNIKNHADKFSIAPVLFGVIGLLVLLFAVFHSIAGDGASDGYMVASALLALAFWLYFIAQLIHIRANTEK